MYHSISPHILLFTCTFIKQFTLKKKKKKYHIRPSNNSKYWNVQNVYFTRTDLFYVQMLVYVKIPCFLKHFFAIITTKTKRFTIFKMSSKNEGGGEERAKYRANREYWLQWKQTNKQTKIITTNKQTKITTTNKQTKRQCKFLMTCKPIKNKTEEAKTKQTTTKSNERLTYSFLSIFKLHSIIRHNVCICACTHKQQHDHRLPLYTCMDINRIWQNLYKQKQNCSYT